MLNFTPTMHIAYAWVLETERANIFAVLTQEPGSVWRLQVSYRVFVDDKLKGSRDRHNNYSFDLTKSEPQEVVITKATRFLNEISLPLLGPTVKRSVIPVDGDIYRAIDLFNEHPSLHFSMPPGLSGALN